MLCLRIFSQKTLVFCGYQILLSLGSSKGSKKPPTDLIRAHSKETPSREHGSVRSDRTVGHELRTGPQLKPKRLRIQLPGSHLDSSGRRDGAPPRRPQPPASAEESSAEQLRTGHMYKSVYITGCWAGAGPQLPRGSPRLVQARPGSPRLV